MKEVTRRKIIHTVTKALILTLSIVLFWTFQVDTLSASRCGQITVRWSTSEGAEEYELYRGGQHIYTGKENEYTDSGLIFGQTYSYRVRAVNRVGRSPLSREVRITSRDICAPQKPESLDVHPFSCGGKTLVFWTPSKSARVYELSRGRTVVYRGSDPYFFDSGLRINRNYTYTVRSWNSSGWSDSVSQRGIASDRCPPSTPDDIYSTKPEDVGAEGAMDVSLSSRPGDGVVARRSGSRVAVFDFDVRYSDMVIKRVDIYFDKDPRRFLEEVSIGTGFSLKDRVSVPIGRDSVRVISSGNEYRVRFSSLSFELPENRNRSLTVWVTPRSDRKFSEDMTVYLRNSSIRTEDTLFISHTLPTREGGFDGAFSRKFTAESR